MFVCQRSNASYFWLFCFNSVSDLTEILPPLLLQPLCILLCLCCLCGTCCFLPGIPVCVSETFREELVAYRSPSQAKPCNFKAEEHNLCPMKKGEEKKIIVKCLSYLGDLNFISLRVWYWKYVKPLCFICPCFFPCQLIWNLLCYVSHQTACCAGIVVQRRNWAC